MAIPKEEGPWLASGERLVCFGDSLTEAADGYVQRLQESLSPRGIEVVNAGHGGDKTTQGLARMRSDVIDLHPDAVSLFFGNNDCIIGRGQWRDEPQVSPLTFQQNLEWMIHLMRLAGIRKFSINTPTPRMEGIQFRLFGDVRREYCLAARTAADHLDARLVPLDAVFAALWETNHPRQSPQGLLYTKDGLHMTREGYALIADAMLTEWNLATSPRQSQDIDPGS